MTDTAAEDVRKIATALLKTAIEMREHHRLDKQVASSSGGSQA